MTDTPTDRLVLLCGVGPTPLIVALDTFQPREVVLIHGPAIGAATARRIREMYPGIDVTLLEVPADDPAEIRAKLGESLPLLADATLVFGAGTTPMNVMAYSAWNLANINSESADHEAWYLSARERVFKSDLGSRREPEATGLSIERLAVAHAEPGVEFSFEVDVLAGVRDISDSDVDVIGWAVEHFLDPENLASFPEVYRGLNLSAGAWGFFGGFISGRVGRASIGHFFEAAEALLLARYFESRVDELLASVKLRKNGGAIFELDIVARSRDRLLVVSSGIGSKEYRLKSLEVDTRANHLGGSETWGLTLGRDVTPQSRENLLGELDRRRFNLIDLRDFFGASVIETLRAPGKALHAEGSSEVGKWLEGWLGGR